MAVWPGSLAFAVDIGERHRAEEKQSGTLSLLRATLDSSADGILVVDNSGRISAYNGSFAEIWDIPVELLESGDDEQAIAHVLSRLTRSGCLPSSFDRLLSSGAAEYLTKPLDVAEFLSVVDRFLLQEF
jgi:PAS domain-containing protein